MKYETVGIAAVPVSMLPEPVVPSEKHPCSKCGTECWISIKASKPLMERGAAVWCNPCIADLDGEKYFTRNKAAVEEALDVRRRSMN